MMSKRISPLLVFLAVLGLAVTVIPLNHSVDAFATQRAAVATNAARNASIVATTAEVLKETSEIRELSILRPVKSGAQSRTEIERMLVKNLTEQMTPSEMHATELTLRKFGLVPNDFEYRSFIIKLLTEQVAGYYDSKTREFHLADWLDLEGQRPVMVHELTHALQDQHFHLRRFEKWPHGDSDAEMAAHALIEGDATLAMTIYMAQNPLVALAFTRSLGSTAMATVQFNQAPRALRESLVVFPYGHGTEWATQLYKRGGWSMLSKAFTQLPLSSEQIIHPEKYFSYERPVKVVLPDLTNLLNASSQQTATSKQQTLGSTQQSTGNAGVSPASVRSKPLTRQRRLPVKDSSLPTANRPLPIDVWHRIDTDVNGEWSYYLILDQFLNAPADSRRASAGWAGDRYAVYEGPNGQAFLAQIAAWDSENDAREFFDAYVKRIKLRYSDAEPLASTEPQTRNAETETRNIYSWTTCEGRVTIELRSLRVLILEGVPDGISLDGLTRAFGQ